MKSDAKTVAEYLAALPAERQEVIQAVREIIIRHLPSDFEETMQYGMISYVVPHSVYPAGYHCDPKQPLPYISLSSQKNHLALYLMGNYLDPTIDHWFREEYAKTGKKLNMGKSCLRFKKLEDLALDTLSQLIAKTSAANYIKCYEQCLNTKQKPSK